MKIDKNEIRGKVASNLGQAELGSYLHTLVDGMLDISERVVSEIDKDFKELKIDTASAEALEAYGASKGLPRVKSRLAFSKVSSGEVSLEPRFFVHTSGLNLTLFRKGDKLSLDDFKLTFLEDVNFNSDMGKVFVSCEFSGVQSTYIREGKTYPIPVPELYKTVLSGITLMVELPLGFSSQEEDIETYRAKLKSLMVSENISSEDTINKLIASSGGVHKYFVDTSSYPTTVYYMSPLMYYNSDLESTVRRLEQSLRMSTDAVRGYTSNFDFSIPEKVEFKIDLITADSESLRVALEDLLTTFVSNHVLGYEMVLDKAYITTFLGAKNINQPLEVRFYYTDGYNIAPAGDRLVIPYNGYPKLHSITINGDYSEAEI